MTELARRTDLAYQARLAAEAELELALRSAQRKLARQMGGPDGPSPPPGLATKEDWRILMPTAGSRQDSDGGTQAAQDTRLALFAEAAELVRDMQGPEEEGRTLQETDGTVPCEPPRRGGAGKPEEEDRTFPTTELAAELALAAALQKAEQADQARRAAEAGQEAAFAEAREARREAERARRFAGGYLGGRTSGVVDAGQGPSADVDHDGWECHPAFRPNNAGPGAPGADQDGPQWGAARTRDGPRSDTVPRSRPRGWGCQTPYPPPAYPHQAPDWRGGLRRREAPAPQVPRFDGGHRGRCSANSFARWQNCVAGTKWRR